MFRFDVYFPSNLLLADWKNAVLTQLLWLEMPAIEFIK